MLTRARTVVAKGPAHLVNLTAFYAGQFFQTILGAWRPAAISEAAFLAELSPGRDRQAAAEYLRSRARPNFFFQLDRLAGLVEQIEPAARQQTVAAAEAICRREFHFRGERPVTFRDTVDWFHRPGVNTDWTWELNRHAYFDMLGRAYAYTRQQRFLEAFRELALDWLRQNPPGIRAPNWAGVLEVAFRANLWVWAYHHFRRDLDDDALLANVRGLWWMGRYLAANLEYTSPNNHLLLEAKALALLGLQFPELRAAGHWRRLGERVLWAEVRRQVRLDGGHAEQASLYHQIITSELLEYLTLLNVNGQSAPEDICLRFTRMLEFERGLLKPDGELPLYGDSAHGDSYVRFRALAGGAVLLNRPDLAGMPADEATLWLTAGRAQPTLGAPSESRAFAESGYFVMRAGAGPSAAYLLFDCGPFGYPPAPGHGHADALSFELFAGGQTLLVDPGVYSYHLGARWRNYFRGTAAHNTLRVDGRDQSELEGEMRVLRPARATLHAWVSTDAYDFVDGAHDGYTRLAQPVVHRRQILFVKPDYWLVFDQLTGPGRHELEWLFHLTPEATITHHANGVLWSRCDGAGLWIAPLHWPVGAQWQIVAGQETPVQGWVSHRSGEKCAAPVARYVVNAALPAHFVTLLWPEASAQAQPFQVAPLDVHDDSGQALTEPAVSAVCVSAASWTDVLVVDRREGASLKRFSGQASAERLCWVRRTAAESRPREC
jgi:uncharacterized heparinase superfamily protein